MTHLEGGGNLLCRDCAVQGADQRQPSSGRITEGADCAGWVDDRLARDTKQGCRCAKGHDDFARPAHGDTAALQVCATRHEHLSTRTGVSSRPYKVFGDALLLFVENQDGRGRHVVCCCHLARHAMLAQHSTAQHINSPSTHWVMPAPRADMALSPLPGDTITPGPRPSSWATAGHTSPTACGHTQQQENRQALKKLHLRVHLSAVLLVEMRGRPCELLRASSTASLQASLLAWS